MKLRFILLGIILSSTSSIAFSSDVWWMVEGYEGTCSKSVDENNWKTPEYVTQEFGCSVLSEDLNLVVMKCPEDDEGKEEQQFVFSKDEVTCRVFAKILANDL